MSTRQRGEIVRGVVAALAGGGLFCLFLLGFGFGVLLSLAGALAGYLAGWLIAAPRGQRDALSVRMSAVDRQAVEVALREGRSRLARLNELARRLPDKAVRGKVQAIGEITERIFADLRQDPKDIRAARQFLNYYLDATVNVLEKYVALSAHGVRAPEVRESLRRVEGNLERIRAAFEKQLARLLEDDVLDLDAEIGLLEKTIRLEGLGEEHSGEA